MNQNTQIIQAFEELEMTPAQIAEQFPPLTETAVKACLMQFSGKYREQMDVIVDYNFSDKEAVKAKEVCSRLLNYSDDEHLQFKIAKYILDDKKGRLDIGKNMEKIQMNVIMFQQFLSEANEATNKAKEKKALNNQPSIPRPTAETIDV